MDYEAIARKAYAIMCKGWRGETEEEMTPWDEVSDEVREVFIESAKADLEAAGVPEMEAQCAAMLAAIQKSLLATNWQEFLQYADGPLHEVVRDPKAAGRAVLARLEAAEKVCKAVSVFKDEFCIGCSDPAKTECGTCEIARALDVLREWEALQS